MLRASEALLARLGEEEGLLAMVSRGGKMYIRCPCTAVPARECTQYVKPERCSFCHMHVQRLLHRYCTGKLGGGCMLSSGRLHERLQHAWLQNGNGTRNMPGYDIAHCGLLLNNTHCVRMHVHCSMLSPRSCHQAQEQRLHTGEGT